MVLETKEQALIFYNAYATPVRADTIVRVLNLPCNRSSVIFAAPGLAEPRVFDQRNVPALVCTAPSGRRLLLAAKAQSPADGEDEAREVQAAAAAQSTQDSASVAKGVAAAVEQVEAAVEGPDAAACARKSRAAGLGWLPPQLQRAVWSPWWAGHPLLSAQGRPSLDALCAGLSPHDWAAAATAEAQAEAAAAEAAGEAEVEGVAEPADAADAGAAVRRGLQAADQVWTNRTVVLSVDTLARFAFTPGTCTALAVMAAQVGEEV